MEYKMINLFNFNITSMIHFILHMFLNTKIIKNNFNLFIV